MNLKNDELSLGLSESILNAVKGNAPSIAFSNEECEKSIEKWYSQEKGEMELAVLRSQVNASRTPTAYMTL